MDNMKIKYSVISEKGKRPENQDAVFVGVYEEYAVFLVADGMGGHSHGEIASAAVREAIKEWWETILRMDQMPNIEDAEIQCQDAVQRVNKELYQKFASSGVIVGTTLVLLLIWQNKYTALSVGDSRIYKREGRELECITIDDVWENQTEIKEKMSEEQAKNDSRFGKLVAAIGVHEDVDIHCYCGEIRKRDLFFLCSDGVYKFCDDKQMRKILYNTVVCRNIEKINRKIIKIVEKNQSKDNYSAIICDI